MSFSWGGGPRDRVWVVVVDGAKVEDEDDWVVSALMVLGIAEEVVPVMAVGSYMRSSILEEDALITM